MFARTEKASIPFSRDVLNHHSVSHVPRIEIGLSGHPRTTPASFQLGKDLVAYQIKKPFSVSGTIIISFHLSIKLRSAVAVSHPLKWFVTCRSFFLFPIPNLLEFQLTRLPMQISEMYILHTILSIYVRAFFETKCLQQWKLVVVSRDFPINE
jgi:hypothetical protein